MMTLTLSGGSLFDRGAALAATSRTSPIWRQVMLAGRLAGWPLTDTFPCGRWPGQLSSGAATRARHEHGHELNGSRGQRLTLHPGPAAHFYQQQQQQQGVRREQVSELNQSDDPLETPVEFS